MSMVRSTTLVFVFLLIVSVYAEAQSFYAYRRERTIMLVAGTGTSTYFGELSNPKDYIDAKPNINAGLQFFLTNRISARAEVVWFQLSGSDSEADDNSRKKRNLSFTSDNIEASLTGAFSFFPQGRRFYQRPGFNIYGFAGVGLIYFNPKTEYQGQKQALQPLQTELKDYSRFAPVVPFGLGIKLKVNPLFNLSLEGGYRKAFTDYLDDVSTVHAGPAAFSDPIAAALSDRRPEFGLAAAPAGTKRGNPESKDGYMLINAKIEYYLPFNFSGPGGGNRKLYNSKRKPSYNFYKRKRR